jgi:oxygen-independent coproporphyrinogen-3 oxidase
LTQVKAGGAAAGEAARMNVETLLAKYDRRVPRYTSYPTAPHFSPAVTGETYAGWLAAVADGTPLSLYLHVPFCDRLCLFCGCHTSVVHRRAPLDAYAETLLAEIDLLAGALGRGGPKGRMPVRHIHWGGGTPTALPPEWLVAVTARLRSRFEVLPDAEMAVEIDPRTLSAEALGALAEMGVTRASLGVQDFDPKVQAAIDRVQSFAMTAECARRLRGIGVASINLDLIYGLPHQSVAGVRETVTRALEIAPERIAVFGYAHVPWMKKQQALLPAEALPGPAERFAQREAAEQAILAAGYERIGLDHFTRPGDSLSEAAATGRLRRNFQGYTSDDALVLLGIGASSIGSLPQGYVQNEARVPAWRDAVRAGRLPVARGIALSGEDALRRAVIERIMCRFAVDLAEVAAAHGADPSGLGSAAPALDELARDGLVEWDGRRVAVTPEGQPFVRAVAAAFDAYLAGGAGRHAPAI